MSTETISKILQERYKTVIEKGTGDKKTQKLYVYFLGREYFMGDVGEKSSLRDEQGNLLSVGDIVCVTREDGIQLPESVIVKHDGRIFAFGCSQKPCQQDSNSLRYKCMISYNNMKSGSTVATHYLKNGQNSSSSKILFEIHYR